MRLDDHTLVANFIKRVQLRQPNFFAYYDYSEAELNRSNGKIKLKCPAHGEFWTNRGDHLSGYAGCSECSAEKRKKTLLAKYGVDNFFKRTDLVEKAMLKKHGVKNPGLLPDHVAKIQETSQQRYGILWANQTDVSKAHRKKTNLEKFGHEYPMQNTTVSKKMVATKIKTGGFTKSNSSKQATSYIKSYIESKHYDLSQCAFASAEDGLYEWGIYVSGRWLLFDLVVFEKGHRGNKEKILEILEFHGPFHYNEIDVQLRGNDAAYPWKTNRTTIMESYMRDKEKEAAALLLTDKFTTVWGKDL